MILLILLSFFAPTPGQLGTDAWHFPVRIDALAAAPTGTAVAVSHGRHVTVVDPRTGARLAEHEASCAPLDALAWTAAGLVAGCNSRFLTGPRLFVWQDSAQPRFVALTAEPITQVGLWQWGALKLVAAGGPQSPLQIWSVGNGRLLHSFEPLPSRKRPRAVADLSEVRVKTAEGGLEISTGRHRDLLIVHERLPPSHKKRSVKRLLTPGHQASITECAVSPDGQRAATIDFDGAVHSWRIADGQLLDSWRISPPGRAIFALDDAFVGWLDDQQLLAGSGSGGVFQLKPGRRPVRRPERRAITHVHLAALGQRGVFLSRDGRLSLRTLNRPRERWTLHGVEGRARRVRRADISADGQRLLVVTGEVSVHDGARGTRLWQGPGEDAALSADGRIVATATPDVVTLHNLETGAIWSVPVRRPTALALDATGAQLAFAHRGGIEVHRWGQLAPSARFQPSLNRPISWLRFAQGHLLAHAEQAPSVRVFPLPAPLAEAP